MGKPLTAMLLVACVIMTVSSSKIRGLWKTSMIANVITPIEIRITDKSIKLDYNTTLIYDYNLQGNHIKTFFYSSLNNKNINRRPSEDDVKRAISNFKTIELNGDTLKIKDGNNKYVAVLKKIGNVDPDPVIVATPPPIYVEPVVVVAPPPPVDVGPLRNIWSVKSVKGVLTVFDVKITNTNMQFTFCNQQSLPFTIDGKKIRIENKFNLQQSCPNLFPLEPDVLNAFVECNNYEINDYFLYLKNGDNVIILLERV